jgi:LruC domain-containing protein
MNNSALSFNGVNSNITIPNASNLNLTNTITLMAWVKTLENKTAKIVQKGDWDGYGLGIDKWNGWFGHIMFQDGNKVSLKWQEGTPLLDEWYNLVLTYDGQTLKFYVNGLLKNSEQVEGLMKVNSRSFSIGSDNGRQKFFNGSIDEVYLYGTALSADEILNYYQQEDAPDTDGDGVPDDDDDYPTDVNRAFDNYYPAKRYGTLMFEDLWPGKGDYDFNDMVLDFRMNRITDAHNKLVEVKLNFLLKAIGAGMPNGFGFQMNNDKLLVEDLSVSGINLVSDYINIDENNLETGQSKPTIIVFDDANIVMPPPTGFGVNVNLENPYVEPVEFSVVIEFPLNKYKKSKFKIRDFNPFIIVNKKRGKEIHLANFPPTDLADLSLFGTYEDNSNVGEKRFYKTSNNLPWAILVPRVIEQPLEKQEITTAYLKFYDWASSGGTEFTNWYKNKNGFRNDANIYYPPEN